MEQHTALTSRLRCDICANVADIGLKDCSMSARHVLQWGQCDCEDRQRSNFMIMTWQRKALHMTSVLAQECL